MPPEEHARQERFARFRRWKQVLRFLPRRAALHRYPFIGRFAEAARKRSFLWSFKAPQLRPAFYAGSILAVMPVMGVQLPAAFVLALLLRANFMVLGGLQFISNPVTAAPLYFTTYEVGRAIITWSGFGQSVAVEEEPELDLVATTRHHEQLEPAKPDAPPDGELNWGRRIGTVINALVIGGAIVGTLLGALLDLTWRLLAERIGPVHLHLRRGSRSTEPIGPPQ